MHARWPQHLTAATSRAQAPFATASHMEDLPVAYRQLHQTRLCAKFHYRGVCRSDCTFAHSARELRCPPDLRKTSLCRAWRRGQCNAVNCWFAHGEAERRATTGLFKTQLCQWFESGRVCKYGDRCRHAHGESELRQGQPIESKSAGKFVYAV